MKRKQWIPVILYTLCILFITLFSRTTYLVPRVELTPFWSVLQWIGGSASNGRSIILNVGLFIPLGYLLSVVCKRRWTPVLAGFLLSLLIETIQHLTLRGICDVDDLIFNTFGAFLGVLIHRWIPIRWSYVAVIVGLVGCIYTASIDTEPVYERQFYFDAMLSDTLAGHCYIFDNPTPNYQIMIGGKTVRTARTGDEYRTDGLGEGEIRVRFSGHQPISTGVWIRDGQLKYTAENVEVEGVPASWTLMVYNPDPEVLIYQDGDRLVWLIGAEIDRGTEVIYHIHTDEPEKLPEHRQVYKFDNRGFREGGANELESIGKYRVFEREIPQEYNVTSIAVGFNTAGVVVWSDYFRPIQQ